MGSAASKIKVTHYAKIPPKHESKNISSLCGFSVPIKETTEDASKVNCFLCREKMEKRGC